MNSLLDLFFLSLSLVVFAAGIGRHATVFFSIYALSYTIFVIGAHFFWRTANDIDYETNIYAISHIFMLCHLILMSALLLKLRRYNDAIQDKIQSISSHIINFSIYTYFAFYAYVYLKYGISGINSAASTSEIANIDSIQKNYIENSIEMLLGQIGEGALFIVVFKLSLDRTYIQNIRVLIPSLVLLFFMLAFGKAFVGGRRMVLILGACYIASSLTYSRRNAFSALYKKIIISTTALLFVVVLSTYYQQIRSNFRNDNIQHKLLSDEYTTKADGVADILSPSHNNTRSSYNSDESLINRGGPFDLFYGVVESRLIYNISSQGELFMHSFQQFIPSIIYPEKPMFGLDSLIYTRLGITPHLPAGSTSPTEWIDSKTGAVYLTDYSKSPQSLLFADFGWIGIVVAATILSLCFIFCLKILLLIPSKSLLLPGVFGVIFDLISSIEGNVTGELASVRAAVLFLFLSLLFRFIGQIVPKRSL